jgi:hypothetical protein
LGVERDLNSFEKGNKEWDFAGPVQTTEYNTRPLTAPVSPPARAARSHRLEAQDTALSRLVRGFESLWERQFFQ